MTRKDKIKLILRAMRSPEGISDHIINIVYRLLCE